MSRNPTPHLSDEQILFTYRTFNGILLDHLLPEAGVETIAFPFAP